MYYEERICHGVLYWRGTPDGEWTEFTLVQMCKKYKEQIERTSKAESRLGMIESKLQRICAVADEGRL